MTAVATKPLGQDATGLRSVSISTRVIGCFTRHEELGPTQVARELGIAKSTAHEMLVALAAGGLLDRTARGRYRLSLQLFDFGQLVLDRLPIRRIARPELLALHRRVEETVQLGLPAGGRVVYVERFDHGSLPEEASGEWMRKVSGFASSSGRVLAAFDPEIAEATLALPRTRYTPRTIVDTTRLRQVLARAREQGWVCTSEERASGLTSMSAPVFAASGRVCAAVSIVGRTRALTGTRGEFVLRSLVVSAQRISTELAVCGEE